MIEIIIKQINELYPNKKVIFNTIFGEVIDGYAVVEKIENCQTGAMDKPVEDQKIVKAYVKK